MIIYFSPTSLPVFEPYIDPCNYYFKGQEVPVPPCSLVICIPCQNLEPEHIHNMLDCQLLTYHRGWDRVDPDDFVTVFVLDHEDPYTSLLLEHGELLSTFLQYNQECFGASFQKCIMGVSPYWPLDIYMAEHECDDEDDGYESNVSV